MRREVRVSVHPKSKKERIIKKGAQSLEIFVKEPAQHNMANTRVRELVAEHYNVLRSDVRQTTGHKSRTKRFIITSA